MTDSTEYLDRAGAAARLGVTGATIWNYAKNGVAGRPPLPAAKLGHKTWRIRVDEFDAWVAARPVANGPLRGRPTAI